MKKKIFLLVFIIGLFFPLSGLVAGSFPNDAKTIQYELTGISSHILLATSTRTILGISVQQSSVASQSNIRCGNIIICKNYGKDFPFNQINYLCEHNISVDKTGQDSASFIITYVDYNIASSTAIGGYASSTPLFMSNNIENIGYIATTTLINAGISITQGTYYIPFILFKFILAILVLSILTVLILYIFKRRD